MNQGGRNKALRVRLTVIILLGAVAALGSFWVLEVMRKQDAANAPRPKRSESDYEVEKFTFVRTGPDGQANYLLSGEKLLHHPLDNSVDITAPIAKNINPTRAPVTIRADTARLLDDNQHVQLNGNVRITRPPLDQAQAMQINAPSLLIMTENDTMQSDDAVEILLGQTRLSGIGLFANNATGQFQLAQKVHGILPPKPRAQP